jgi:hypothetical protein
VEEKEVGAKPGKGQKIREQRQVLVAHSVILATQEAEVGYHGSSPAQATKARPYLKNTEHTKGLAKWLKW